MLFTDGPFIKQSDLTDVEAEVVVVAEAQGITISNIIKSAISEIATWLLARTQVAFGHDIVFDWHKASYVPMYSQAVNRPRLALSQVIVNDPEFPWMLSPLASLTVNEALKQFFQNASRFEGTDRYEEKRDWYAQEIRRSCRPRLEQNGLPIVGTPLPCPGATMEPGSGVFDLTDVSLATGGTWIAGTYDVALTYWNSVQPQNRESAPSARVAVPVTSGHIPVVNISRLRPPAGGTRPEQQARFFTQTLEATHYNVWCGTTGNTMYLQNVAPIPVGTTSFQLPNAPLTAIEVSSGQYADRYISIPDVLYRG